MNDAQTQKFGSCYARFECVIDTKRHNTPPSVELHAQNMYNKTPQKKIVSGQHQDVSGHLHWDHDQMTRHILIGKLGSQGEKKKKKNHW